MNSWIITLEGNNNIVQPSPQYCAPDVRPSALGWLEYPLKMAASGTAETFDLNVNPVSYTHLDVYKRQVNSPYHSYIGWAVGIQHHHHQKCLTICLATLQVITYSLSIAVPQLYRMSGEMCIRDRHTAWTLQQIERNTILNDLKF